MGCAAAGRGGRGPDAAPATLFPPTAREVNVFNRRHARRRASTVSSAGPTPSEGNVAARRRPSAVSLGGPTLSEGDRSPRHDGKAQRGEVEEAPIEGGPVCFYPMYLMSWEVLMGLPMMLCHQEMLWRGQLVPWEPAMAGRIILVSHEWLGNSHPDPEGEQLSVLHRVLRRLASGKVTAYSDWDDPSRVCNAASWRGRGWCRAELFAALLSRTRVRLLRCTGPEAPPEFMFTLDSFVLPPGEGAFTCCSEDHRIQGKQIPCDRVHLRGVFETMLEESADYFAELGMEEERRLLICRREAFLRGLPPKVSAAARPARKPELDPLARLRRDLRWRDCDDALAKAGQCWTLLHWAAFAGDTAALGALLAGGDCGLELRTPRGFPEFGVRSGFRAIHLAAICAEGSFDAARLLLSAGQDQRAAGNAQGRCPGSLLCLTAALGTAAQLAGLLAHFPRCDLELHHRAYFGAGALAAAAFTGPATAEKLRLLLQRAADPHAGSGVHAPRDAALLLAALKEDSDTQGVATLLKARCCPNTIGGPMWREWKAVFFGARLSSRLLTACGRTVGPITKVFAEAVGATPLHAAARKGDVAVARVLIAAAADVNMRNRMGKTPLDTARVFFGGEVPPLLQALLTNGVCALPPLPSSDSSQGNMN